MAETMQTLEELSSLKPAAAPQPPKYVQKLDKQGRAYATGKRKNAVARVWIKTGRRQDHHQRRPVETYFARPVLRMMIQQPLVACNRQDQFDVVCTVSGGGLSGQAGAVRHGLSKALMGYEPDLRAALKHGGFLTRDSRVVERKKYGRAKARRASSSPSANGKRSPRRSSGGRTGPASPCRRSRSPRNRPLTTNPQARQSSVDQKNARVRISMLSRGRACGGVVGSSNAVCAVQRARPSFIKSNTLNM